MEKTIVNGQPVSESGLPNGAGESQKEIENRVRENLRAEYDRKAEERLEELVALRTEKAELESKNQELTRAEQSRLNSLNTEQAQIEAQIRELDTKPEFAGYREKISRESARAKQEAVAEARGEATHETSKILMAEFLERKAEAENIPIKQLKEELNSVLKIPGSDRIKYADLMPHERVKAAYADRAEKSKARSMEEELKRMKAERDGFSEDGSRMARDTRSTAQLREAAVSGDENAALSLARDLDARQKEYDSQNK